MIKNKNLFISLFILLVLIPAFLFPTSTLAVNDIKLISTSTKSDFPNALTFFVKAESPTNITRIRLRYEVDKTTYAPSFAEFWPAFTPSNSVSTSWVWDMRKGSLPPGASITYWWVIEDSSGNKLTSQRETVQFNDTRYKWQKINRGKISLFWYKGDTNFASTLLNAAVEAADRLGKDTGAPLDKPASIYIYASYADLRGSLVATEEWTGGVAYAGFNTISIGISPNNLDWGKKAVAHELGHLVTHQITTSPYGSDLPPWLDEGLAMHAEGEQNSATVKALLKAIKEGQIATLQSLSSPFPADPEAAYYAYAQSQSVVEFLISKYGNSKMNQLLVTFNEGYTMNEALYRVYGFDLQGLDKAWIEYMLSTKEKLEQSKVGESFRTFEFSCCSPVMDAVLSAGGG